MCDVFLFGDSTKLISRKFLYLQNYLFFAQDARELRYHSLQMVTTSLKVNESSWLNVK